MPKYGYMEGGALRYAPYAVMHEGVSRKVDGLSAEEARAHGWKPLIIEQPDAREGYSFEPVGWEETAEAIRRTWEERAIPAVVRSWTPLSIRRACGADWPLVKSALTAHGIYDEFLMAQELREDDPDFATGRAWAEAQFGADKVTAILNVASQVEC